MNAKPIFIFAGSNEQAQMLADELGMDRRRWRYLSSPRAIQGHDNCLVIFTGTWYERSDKDEITPITSQFHRHASVNLDDVVGARR